MDLIETIVKLHDKDLEEVVLGAVLIESHYFKQLSAEWNEDVFFYPANKTIAWAMKSMFMQNQSIDLLTLTSFLRLQNKLENVGGAYYLASLSNRVASTANTYIHYQYLQGYYLLRIESNIGEEIKLETMQPGFHPMELALEISAKFEKKISSITTGIFKQSVKTVGEVNRESLVTLDKVRLGEIPYGLKIGYKGLDMCLGGWQKSDLIILAARPAMGKTALALKYALKPALESKIPTAFFSLEMTKLQLVRRLQVDFSGIDAEKIRKGELTQEDFNYICQITDSLDTAPFFIDDTPAITVFEFKSKARRLVAENGVQLIVIDYLQLMRANIKGGNREQEISYISRELKATAKELDVPIIALSQLSRDLEKRGAGSKRPQLSDLRESGAIEQDADQVQFIYRPEYYGLDTFEDNEPSRNKAEIIIAKNRHGAISTVRMGFIPHKTRFCNLGEENQPLSQLEPNTNFNEEKF